MAQEFKLEYKEKELPPRVVGINREEGWVILEKDEFHARFYIDPEGKVGLDTKAALYKNRGDVHLPDALYQEMFAMAAAILGEIPKKKGGLAPDQTDLFDNANHG